MSGPVQNGGIDAGALRRALAEYPGRNTHQLQARKVCDGVVALALTYGAEAKVDSPQQRINEVRERLMEVANLLDAFGGVAGDDTRALLADHARLQAELDRQRAHGKRWFFRAGEYLKRAQSAEARAAELEARPAIDLEQFREAVKYASRTMPQLDYAEDMAHLLALIEGNRRSEHPAGTPMMPVERFYDGCWKLLPEHMQHHGGMLTQSWRTADSTELKAALEAGVLALFDASKAGQARSIERPANCRERLRIEGRPYPKSGCAHCKTGGMTGCPYESAVHQDGEVQPGKQALSYDPCPECHPHIPCDACAGDAGKVQP